jgi:hypothetical protein
MGRTNAVSQPADGIPRSYWLDFRGTSATGIEVLLPSQSIDPDGNNPQVGFNISNIYTWISYPSGRNPPPPNGPTTGGVVSELVVTITPPPDGSTPIVEFTTVWESLNP